MRKINAKLGILVSAAFLAGCATLDSITGSLSNFSEKLSQSADEKTSERNKDADKWDIAALDTARDAGYLSTVEKDVILEMNKARSNPALYAELYIEPRLKYFDGKLYEGTLMTNEGDAVVKECAQALRKAKPLPVLAPMKGLSLAAQGHAKTQGETNQTGHTGVDGSTPFTRIQKYGTYKTAGENIAYGATSGREIVVQLLIDDGGKPRAPQEHHEQGVFRKRLRLCQQASGVRLRMRHNLCGRLPREVA